MHGNYPIYPRTRQSHMARPSHTVPNVWPYAGRDFDFSLPLVSSVAKLHYFARQELSELSIPDHLAEDYQSRWEAYLRRRQEEGSHIPFEVRRRPYMRYSFYSNGLFLQVELTKEDIRKYNQTRGTPLPRRNPHYPTSLQWDADTMRCLMSSALVGCMHLPHFSQDTTNRSSQMTTTIHHPPFATLSA